MTRTLWMEASGEPYSVEWITLLTALLSGEISIFTVFVFIFFLNVSYQKLVAKLIENDCCGSVGMQETTQQNRTSKSVQRLTSFSADVSTPWQFANFIFSFTISLRTCAGEVACPWDSGWDAVITMLVNTLTSAEPQATFQGVAAVRDRLWERTVWSSVNWYFLLLFWLMALSECRHEETFERKVLLTFCSKTVSQNMAISVS